MNLVNASGDLGLNPYEQLSRMEKQPKSEQIARAAEQFEGIFIRQILDEALKPMSEGLFGGDMPGKGIYQSLMVDSLADGISKGGGLGLSHIIQLSMQGSEHGISDDADDNA